MAGHDGNPGEPTLKPLGRSKVLFVNSGWRNAKTYLSTHTYIHGQIQRSKGSICPNFFFTVGTTLSSSEGVQAKPGVQAEAEPGRSGKEKSF